jgi:oligoribonuclease
LQSNLIWMDLEMTGLDPENHVIIELASIVTDPQLRIIAEGPTIAIHHSQEILSGMEAWSRTHHHASGLLNRVEESTTDTKAAERETIAFLSAHCNPGECPLCGNSVWQDRRFLAKHMPELEKFCHYRIIDVSSVKELARRWYPDLPPYPKRKAHLALDDIKESIEELAYFRRIIFLAPSALEVPEIKQALMEAKDHETS